MCLVMRSVYFERNGWNRMCISTGTHQREKYSWHNSRPQMFIIFSPTPLWKLRSEHTRLLLRKAYYAKLLCVTIQRVWGRAWTGYQTWRTALQWWHRVTRSLSSWCSHETCNGFLLRGAGWLRERGDGMPVPRRHWLIYVPVCCTDKGIRVSLVVLLKVSSVKAEVKTTGFECTCM